MAGALCARRRASAPLPCACCLPRGLTTLLWPFGPHGLSRRCLARGGRPPACGGFCLAGQCRRRSDRLRLALQRTRRCPGPPRRGLSRALPPRFRRRRGALFRPLARARRRRLQLDAGATRLREADRDCLLRRSRAVLPFANVMDLFAYKLASLCRGRLAGTLCLAGALDSRFFRHVFLRRPISVQRRCHFRRGTLLFDGSGVRGQAPRDRALRAMHRHARRSARANRSAVTAIRPSRPSAHWAAPIA